MEITNADLDKMYDHIRNKVPYDYWFPVKSDKAYEAIKQMMQNGELPDIEFDSKELHIRKVHLFEYDCWTFHGANNEFSMYGKELSILLESGKCTKQSTFKQSSLKNQSNEKLLHSAGHTTQRLVFERS